MAEIDDANSSDRWRTVQTIAQGDRLVVTGTAVSQASGGEQSESLPFEPGDEVTVIERTSTDEARVLSANGRCGVLPLGQLKRKRHSRDDHRATEDQEEEIDGGFGVGRVADYVASKTNDAGQTDIEQKDEEVEKKEEQYGEEESQRGGEGESGGVDEEGGERGVGKGDGEVEADKGEGGRGEGEGEGEGGEGEGGEGEGEGGEGEGGGRGRERGETEGEGKREGGAGKGDREEGKQEGRGEGGGRIGRGGGEGGEGEAEGEGTGREGEGDRRLQKGDEGHQGLDDGKAGGGGSSGHVVEQAMEETQHNAKGGAAVLSQRHNGSVSASGTKDVHVHVQTDRGSRKKDAASTSAAAICKATLGGSAKGQSMQHSLSATGGKVKLQHKVDQGTEVKSPAISKKSLLKEGIRRAQEFLDGRPADQLANSLGELLDKEMDRSTCLDEICQFFERNKDAEFINIDNLAEELLHYTSESDDALCFGVCSLVLELSIRRLLSVKAKIHPNVSKVSQSKEFRDLAHALGKRAASLEKDFWKDSLFLSSEFVAKCGDGLFSRLINVLSTACFVKGANYMLALIAVESNIRRHNGWRTKSWLDYLGRLQLASFVNEEISPIFQAISQFHDSITPKLDGHTLAQIIDRLCRHWSRKKPVLTTEGLSPLMRLTSACTEDKSGRHEVLHAISKHILKTVPSASVFEFVEHMLILSIRDFDYETMSSVLRHLVEDTSKGKADCNKFAALLEMLLGITSSITMIQGAKQDMTVLKECFVEYWCDHCDGLPVTWITDMQPYLTGAQVSVVKECCIGLASTLLRKDQLANKKEEEVAALVDVLHNDGRDDLITERLIGILDCFDCESLTQIICSSKCLSQSYEVQPEGVQKVMALMIKKMKFSSLPNIKDVLEEADDYYQQVRCASPLHSRNSMVALLWTSCVTLMQHQITRLIQKNGVEQLEPLKKFRLQHGEGRNENMNASHLDLIATAYLHILLGALDADTGMLYHEPLWLIPYHMLYVCYEAYESGHQNDGCFCLDKYKRLCKCMADLQQKLDRGNYTQAEFKAYSDHVQELEEILGALRLTPINGIRSFEELVAKANKLRLLLEWLQGQGVEGSHQASSHLVSLANDKNVTYHDMNLPLVAYQERFVKPLSMSVANDCTIPVADYIYYFTEKRSHLFQEFACAAAPEASPKQVSSHPWPKRVKALIHSIHSRFKQLMSGQLKIEHIYCLLGQGLAEDRSISNSEIRVVYSDGPYCNISLAHNVKTTDIIEKTIDFIAIAQSPIARTGCDTVISHHFLSPDDEIFAKFHALCSKPLGDYTLAAFYDEFSGLMHACDNFQDLQNALTLLSKAKECTKLMAFFQENDCHSERGKEYFTQKKDVLNAQLHQMSFDAALVNAFIDVHSMLAPLFLAGRALNKPPFTTLLHELAGNEVFNVNSLSTVEQNMFRLKELWEEATAGTAEVTVQQLQRLINSGTVHLQLRARMCQPSKMEFSYCHGNPALDMDDNGCLSEEEMRDFRSRLQYLLVLQPEETATGEGSDEESDLDAIKFSALLQKVDDLWSVLLCLERLGHPDFQQCVYSIPLNYSTIAAELNNMITVQNDWKKSLQRVQQEYSLLQLLSHNDIGVLLLLLKRASFRHCNGLHISCHELQYLGRATEDVQSSFSEEANLNREEGNGAAVVSSKISRSNQAPGDCSKDHAPLGKYSPTLGRPATLPIEHPSPPQELPKLSRTEHAANATEALVFMEGRRHLYTEHMVAIEHLQSVKRQDLTSVHDIDDADFTKELLDRFMFSLETTHFKINPGYTLSNLYQECPQLSNRAANYFLEVLANALHRRYTIPPDLLKKHPEQVGRQVVYFFQSDGEMCITTDVMLVLADLFVKEHSCFPLGGQVLHCSEQSTEDDLKLFFQRVTSFPYLQFALVGVDQLLYDQCSFVIEQQQRLHHDLQGCHGDVYYICVKSMTTSTWLQPFMETRSYCRDDHPKPSKIRARYKQLCRPSKKFVRVTTVVGKTGSGKSHWILRKLQNAEHREIVTIQASADITSNIRKLSNLKLPWNSEASVFFNISEQCCLPAVNHMFFELLFCGGLQDQKHGALFCFPPNTHWKLYLELPGSCVDGRQPTAMAGATEDYLPLIAAYPWSQEHVVTLNGEPIHWREVDARLFQVADILESFSTPKPDLGQVIQRKNLLSKVTIFGDYNEPVNRVLAPLLRRPPKENQESELMKKEMKQQSSREMGMREKVAFLRFLPDRLSIFEDKRFLSQLQERAFGPDFPLSLLQQFIREAYTLSTPGLACSWRDCDQFFLVPEYRTDEVVFYFLNKPGRLLPSEFSDQATDRTSAALQNTKTSTCGGSHWTVFLQWTFGLTANRVQALLQQEQFVLTYDFTLKLLLVHARQKARLPLIIEGETGVGKTYLLNMYALLLNQDVIHNVQDSSTYHRAREFSKWLLTIIEKEHWGKRDDAVHRWIGETNPSTPISPRDMLLKHDSTSDQLTQIWLDFLLLLMPKANPEVHNKAVCLLADQIQKWYNSMPLLVCSSRTKKIFREHSTNELHWPSTCPLTLKHAEELLTNFFDADCRPFFFRLLIHPGLGMADIEQFLRPICEIAQHEGLAKIHLVIFFDEVNTSRCPGLFKEIVLDNRFNSQLLPKNIFFVAAINPKLQNSISTGHVLSNQGAFSGYNVHDLHPAMDSIKWIYGGLNVRQDIVEYIELRVDFQESFVTFFDSGNNQEVRFQGFLKDRLVDTLVIAHKFCDEKLGPSSVSQRDIQRVFDLIPFFWKVENYYIMHDNEQASTSALSLPFSGGYFCAKKVLQTCAYMAIALVYYFRLPTTSKDNNNCRAEFEEHLRKNASNPQYHHLYKFEHEVTRTLNKFVTKGHFSIPEGVALTSGLKENILCTVACIQQCIPLGIIGPPGSSKTLSYHIVRDNLHGRNSPKSFCSQFVEVDSFFYQCSELSEANEIDTLFKKAIERQRRNLPNQHQPRKVKTRCVVFLDEAGLPPQDRMVLKVLHQFLDKPEVAFVALSNYEFDPANTNRMLTVCRSRDLHDLQTLAEGCVLWDDTPTPLIKNYLKGICHGFEEVVSHDVFGKLFHHRDLIFALRYLRRHQLVMGMQKLVPDCHVLLKALEENFGGAHPKDFGSLVNIFFQAVHKSLELSSNTVDFPSSFQESDHPSELRILESLLHRQPSLKSHDTSRPLKSIPASHECSFSTGHPLAPRFVMIIDPTNAYVALDILHHIGLLTASTSQVIQMTDNPNEIQRAETLAKIRHALEQPQTLVLVNTRSIHGSLYELLNQNFRQMSTHGGSYTYTNIAAGARKHLCRVHENFHCLVVMGEEEMKTAPTPFLSRFSKLHLSPDRILTAALHQLEEPVRASVHQLYLSCKSFLDHVGEMSFFGYNTATLPCLMLSHLKACGRRFVYESTPTPTAALVHDHFCPVAQSEQQLKSRVLCSRLLQLLSPKHFLLKDASLKAGEAYRAIYFHLLTHFSLSEAIWRLLLQPDKEQPTCRKMLIYTPTCHLQWWISEPPENVEIIDTARFVHVSLSDIEHSLAIFIKEQPEKRCAVILVDASRWRSTATKTTDFVLYQKIIDEACSKTEISNNPTCRDKRFTLVVHYPVQQQYACNSCPAKLLHGWDTHLVNGPSREPLLNIPSFAKCCWHNTDITKIQELTSLIQRQSTCLRRELAERWCSHVLNVVGVKPTVLSKLPVQIHPLYQPLHQDESPTAGSRLRALEFALDKCPLILEQISYQVAGRVVQDCHLQFRHLARQAAHEAVSFADLVTEWLASLHSETFIHVVSLLSRDYGFGRIINSELSPKAIKHLLHLTSGFDQLSSPITTWISCSQHVPVTPLFHLLHQQMVDIVKLDIYTHSNDPNGLKRRLHRAVKDNDLLMPLTDCPDVMKIYSYDVLHLLSLAHSTTNETALQIALRWCQLTADDTPGEHDMLSHLHFIMHCYKQDILHFLLGTTALQSISEHFALDLQEKFVESNSILDPDDYKEQFCKHLLLSLWESLVSLSISSSGFAQQIQSWLKGYGLVMEILDSIDGVSFLNMNHIINLMAIAKILLSCCEMLSIEKHALQVFTNILKQLKDRPEESAHLTSSATVTELLTALQNSRGLHCSGELRASFVELLFWLVSRLRSEISFSQRARIDCCNFLDKNDTLHFLIEVINHDTDVNSCPPEDSTRTQSIQGEPFYTTPALELSYEAKKRLLCLVCQELTQLIPEVTHSDHPAHDTETKPTMPGWQIPMKLLVDQQFSKSRKRLSEYSQTGQLCWARFYQPRDADNSSNSSPPALKSVLSCVYFDLRVEDLAVTDVSLELCLQRATAENACTLPTGSHGPEATDIINAAACVRVMLNKMVQEIDHVWNGIDLQLNDLWRRAIAEHLTDQSNCTYNRLYLASQLIRTRGENFAWNCLLRLQEAWGPADVGKSLGVDYADEQPVQPGDLPFSFVENAPFSDHLPGVRQAYKDFSKEFDMCAKKGCFKPLVTWSEKQLRLSANLGQLKHWDCMAMFLLFKVYIDYFSKSDSNLLKIQPLINILDGSTFHIGEESMAYRAIHLLFHCPDNAFSEVKAMFVPGHCETTDMQVIRDILISILGCLLAIGEPGNAFSTCLINPKLLLKSYPLGAVYYRASLHYDLKVDCCFQFEADGSPTFQQPNRTLLNHHFCGLMTFSALLLHSLLYPESCDSNLRAVLTEEVVVKMSVEDTEFVQSAQKLCHYRVAHLRNFFSKDERLHSPTAVVSMVASCLEQLLLLSMNPSLKLLPTYQDQGSRSQAEQMIEEHVLKRGCEFYHIRQSKLQLCGSGKWHGAPAMLMAASNKQPPAITTADLCDAMNEACDPDQLNVMSHLMANITYLSLLPEATDIAQLCLWLHENLSGRLTAAEAQDFNLKTAFDHYLQSSTKQEATLAKEIYRNGLHAFNRSWTLLGGSLQAGSCAEEDCFMKLDDESPLTYVLRARNVEQFSTDILWEVASFLVRKQKDLLLQCRATRDMLPTSTVSHLLAACHLDKAIPFHHVVKQEGNGLVKIQQADLEQLVVMHSELALDNFGRWRAKFNLKELQQVMVSHFLMQARDIELDRSSAPYFEFKPQPPEELRHLAVFLPPLNPDLPPVFVHSKLPNRAKNSLHQKFRRLPYQDVLAGLQKLVLVSNVIQELVSSDRDLDVDKLSSKPVVEFFCHQELAFDDKIESVLCYKDVSLEYVSSLYQLCIYHLNQDEYFFQDGLPALLHCDINPELKKSAAEWLDEVTKALPDPTVTEMVSEAIGCLQAVLPDVTKDPNTPLRKLLQKSKNHCQLLEDLPCDILGHHVKGLIVLLLQEGRRARGEHLNTFDHLQLKHEQQWEEPTEVEAMGESRPLSLLSTPVSSPPCGQSASSQEAWLLPSVLHRAESNMSRLRGDQEDLITPSHSSWYLYNVAHWPLEDILCSSVLLEGEVIWHVNLYKWHGEVISPASPIVKTEDQEMTRFLKIPHTGKKHVFFDCSLKGAYSTCEENKKIGLQRGTFKLTDNTGYILPAGEDVTPTQNQIEMCVVSVADVLTVQFILEGQNSQQLKCEAELSKFVSAKEATRVAMRCFGCIQSARAVLHLESGEMVLPDRLLGDVAHDKKTSSKLCLHLALEPTIVGSKDVPELFLLSYAHEYLSSVLDEPAQATELWPSVQFLSEMLTSKQKVDAWLLHPQATFNVLIIISGMAKLHLKIAATASVGFIKEQVLSRSKVPFSHGSCLCLTPWQSSLPAIPLCDNLILWQLGVDTGVPLVMELVEKQEGPITLCIEMRSLSLEGVQSCNMVSDVNTATAADVIDAAVQRMSSTGDHDGKWALVDVGTQCRLVDKEPISYCLHAPNTMLLLLPVESLCHYVVAISSSEATATATQSSTTSNDHLLYECVGVTCSATCSQVLCHLANRGIYSPNVSEMTGPVRLFASPGIYLSACIRLSCIAVDEGDQHCHFTVGNYQHSQKRNFHEGNIEHQQRASDHHQQSAIVFIELRSAELELQPIKVIVDESTELSALVKFTACSLLQKPPSVCTLHVGAFELTSYSTMAAGTLLTSVSSDLAVRKGLGKYGSHDFPLCCEVREHECTPANCAPGKVMVRATNCLSSSDGAQEFRLYLPLEANAQDIVSAAWAHFEDEERSTYSENNICVKLNLADNNEEIAGHSLADFIQLVPSGVLRFSLCSADTGVPISIEVEDKPETRTQITLPKSTSTTALFSIIAETFSISAPYECHINSYDIEPDEKTTLQYLLSKLGWTDAVFQVSPSVPETL